MFKKLLTKSCEDAGTRYLNIGRRRLIFREGKYAGWYDTRLDRVI